MRKIVLNQDWSLIDFDDTKILLICLLIIFPWVIGHVEVTVIDFFEQVQNHANSSLAIVPETIRSLNICRRKSSERFMGCLPMLYVWLRSHFRCEKSAFKKAYLPHSWPIKEFYENEWSIPKTKERWIAFLQIVSDMEIVWLTPWMPYVPLLYRCGDKSWVQLLGLWGAVSYAPLMVVRQLEGRQFIPATTGLAQLEFSYDDPMASKEIDRIESLGSRLSKSIRV